MNERIREFAFQAMSIDQKVSDDSFFVEVSKLNEFEKFAELIVKEVTNIVLHYTDVDEGVAVAKKHFGVE